MFKPNSVKNDPDLGPASDCGSEDIFINAPIGIFTSTPGGRYLSVNPAMAGLYGYDSPADMLEAVTDIARQIYVNPADRFHLYQALESAESARNYESLHRRKDGSTFWTMESVRVVRDKDGRVRHVQGFVTDISGQVESRQTRREQTPGVDKRLSGEEPDGQGREIVLQNIIDSTAIQQLMSDFCDLTGIGGALLDLQGNVLASTGWQDICFTFHRAHPETNRNCMESDEALSRNVRPGEYRVYRCKNNMLDIVMPIIVEKTHVGNLFTGQFFFVDEPPDHGVFKEQARRFGFDEEDYLAALEKVPLLEKEDVTKALRFYVKLAEIVSTMGYNNLKLERNLAEREELLASLRTSEEMFRSISENIFALIAILDLQGRYTYCNASYSSILGYDPQSLVGTECFALVHQDDQKRALDLFRAGLDGHESRQAEFVLKLVASDGGVKWLEHRASLLPDSQGNPRGILLLAQDVTERLQAEQEIRKFKAVIDQAVHGSAISDLSGNLIYVNKYFAGIHGYTSDELMGRHLSVFHTEQQMEDVRIILDSAMADGQFINREVWHVHKDGTEFPMLMSGVVIKDEQGGPELLAATAIDITERKKAEQALREEAVRRHILIDQSKEGIVVLNEDGSVYETNQRYAEMLGYAPEEVLQLHVWDWQPNFSREQLLEMINKVDATGDHFETRHRRKDGMFHDVEISTNGAVIGGRKLVFCVCRDITERKRSEEALRTAKEQAESANQAKSEFLANMSHEIRTPLNGIMGTMQLLETTALDDEQKQIVLMAIKSANRLTRLLSDILDLSRVEAGKMEIFEAEFDTRELCHSVEELFIVTAREKGIELTCRLDPDTPVRLVGDEARVRQILFNLTGNALKFTNKGSVTVQMVPLASQKRGQCRILISISDTGIGIPEGKLKDLFKPFVQVDGSYTRSFQGAGLGLAIVKRLVNLMDGSISVASTESRGTTVHVLLPFKLPVEAIDPRQDVPGQQHEAKQQLRILLAEDEPSNALATSRLLKKNGHVVTLAENGQQALDLFQRQDFDVILMDVQMPVMNGVEATRRIRGQESELGSQEPESREMSSELQPSTFDLLRPRRIPIIALTAHAMVGDREKFLAAGMDDYLAKPVRMEDLEKLIERVAG